MERSSFSAFFHFLFSFTSSVSPHGIRARLAVMAAVVLGPASVMVSSVLTVSLIRSHSQFHLSFLSLQETLILLKLSSMATSLQHTILIISFIVLLYLLWTGAAVTHRASASAFSSPVGLPMASREIQESMSSTALFQPILPNLSFYKFTPADASIQSYVPRLLSNVSCSVPQLLREHMVPGSSTALFQSILTNLDFQKFSIAIPSLSDSAFLVWNGPSTFFAPTDYVFRTSLETMNPRCCITVTSTDNNTKLFVSANTNTKLFVGAVAITDLDPNLSCSQRVLSLALWIKFPERVYLKNMTVFAVLWLTSTGDFSNMPVYNESIFAGGHAYIDSMRFHITMDRLLMATNLEKQYPPYRVGPSIDGHGSGEASGGNDLFDEMPHRDSADGGMCTDAGCALVASTVGVYLHLLLNIGGLLTTLAFLLTTLACFGNILWLLSTPTYEEKTKVSLLMAAVFFQGACIGPLIDMVINVDPSILISGFVGTTIALGCFSADESLVTCSMQCLIGICSFDVCYLN